MLTESSNFMKKQFSTTLREIVALQNGPNRSSALFLACLQFCITNFRFHSHVLNETTWPTFMNDYAWSGIWVVFYYYFLTFRGFILVSSYICLFQFYLTSTPSQYLTFNAFYCEHWYIYSPEYQLSCSPVNFFLGIIFFVTVSY